MQGRIKRLLVSPELMANLAIGTFTVHKNNVPEGSKIIGAGYDSASGCCEIFIDHPSFPLTQEGDSVPVIEPPIIERISNQPSEGYLS